jgi:hypothetical protein
VLARCGPRRCLNRIAPATGQHVDLVRRVVDGKKGRSEERHPAAKQIRWQRGRRHYPAISGLRGHRETSLDGYWLFWTRTSHLPLENFQVR